MVFKNGPSKICGRQPLKNLKWYGLSKQTISLQIFKWLFCRNFTWSILEYLDPYNVSTLEGEACLKENIHFVMGKKWMFLVLYAPFFLTHVIISNCYWNINTCFNYVTKLLEWFHHLNLLWKCTEFRLVFLSHKIVKYSDTALEL